ncbi:MAG: hypothetical protein WC848_04965 [Parcubacteria group bacterium]|jgi:hypothetical protein
MKMEQVFVLGGGDMRKEKSGDFVEFQSVGGVENFLTYEEEVLKRASLGGLRASKLMRAFVLGTLIVSSSMGHVAIETKSAIAGEMATKVESKEQLQLLISGTIDGKIPFEIYKTNYQREDDVEYQKKIKDADFMKVAELWRKADLKSYKIVVGGKVAEINEAEIYSDGGSQSFRTNLGNFFIAHPLAQDLTSDGRNVLPKKSKISLNDEKDHTIQIKIDNLFKSK